MFATPLADPSRPVLGRDPTQEVRDVAGATAEVAAGLETDTAGETDTAEGTQAETMVEVRATAIPMVFSKFYLYAFDFYLCKFYLCLLAITPSLLCTCR